MNALPDDPFDRARGASGVETPAHEAARDATTATGAAASVTASASGGILRWMRTRRAALGILVAFSVVAWAKPMGLLLWARIRILTSIPKTAIADDPSDVADAGSEVQPELDPGFGVGTTPAIDPFRIDPRMLPTAEAQGATPAPARAGDAPAAEAGPVTTPAVEPAATAPSAEELRLERLRRIEEIRRAGAAFRLQSAGRGLSMAVIDGRTVRLGEVIESAAGFRFTLVEIRDGAATLEFEVDQEIDREGGPGGEQDGEQNGVGERPRERIELRLRSHASETGTARP